MNLGQRIALGKLVLAILAAPSVARAADAIQASSPPSPSGLRAATSLVATGAFVFRAVGYGEYRTGASVRAGADRRLPGRVDQRLGAALALTRFVIPGATLDLPAAEATYRVYPLPVPVYASVSAGLLVSREAFDVTLGRGRRIDDVVTRVGIPGGIALGLTLFGHVELEASYRHVVFLDRGEGEGANGSPGPWSFGHASLALGARQ